MTCGNQWKYRKGSGAGSSPTMRQTSLSGLVDVEIDITWGGVITAQIDAVCTALSNDLLSHLHDEPLMTENLPL